MPQDIKEMARFYTEECIKTAAEIMRDAKASPAGRMAAVLFLKETGHGKAESTANVRVSRNVRDLTDDELLAIAGGAGSAGEADGAEDAGRLH